MPNVIERKFTPLLRKRPHRKISGSWKIFWSIIILLWFAAALQIAVKLLST